MKHKDTNAFTRKDRARRNEVVANALAAQTDIFNGEREFGRHLQVVQAERLYREGGLSIEAFAEATFGIGRTELYNLVAFADLCDVLEHAGVAPLAVKSHALDVVKLATAELQVAAVEHGRELADREGTRLTGRHLKQACGHVNAAMLGSVTVFEPPAGSASEADRAAAQDYAGLLVVLPDASTVDPADLVASVPGGLVVRYHGGLDYPPPSERAADARPFARAKLDDLSDNVWAIITPGPWTPAASWAPADGPFRGVYYPDRLAAPRSRQERDASDSETTVLVAPAVDVFRPEVPDRVVHEVVSAAAADPSRRYLIRTDYPGRAWEDGWPKNVYVCVEAVGTAAAVEAANESLGDLCYKRAIVLRDLVEPIPSGALHGYDWILARGSKTTQGAYNSVKDGLRDNQVFDRGQDVKARHSGYPALPTSRPDPV